MLTCYIAFVVQVGLRFYRVTGIGCCSLPLYQTASPSVHVLFCPRGEAVLCGFDFPWHVRSFLTWCGGARLSLLWVGLVCRRSSRVHSRCNLAWVLPHLLQILFGGGAFAPARARRLATSYTLCGRVLCRMCFGSHWVTAIRRWFKRGPRPFLA